MTFKNKHSFISGFLGAALLIASGCALGGCTEIADEPQGIDDAGNGTPLTIRATASGFVSCVQGDTPATRTPTENGYTTEFNDGDAIGIFALKEYATPDVTPVDGVYNLKLVYTKAADGSGSWAPASGDTHVLYNYDDDLVYVATILTEKESLSNKTSRRKFSKTWRPTPSCNPPPISPPPPPIPAAT